MVRQEYRIHEGGGQFGQLLFENAFRKYRPNALDQMAETWDAGLYHNPVMWGTEILANALDESDSINKEDWNFDHPDYREGVKWFDGMTQLQARIESERYDREELHAGYMKNTDPWAMHNIGAMFASALSDPLTFTPFVGVFSKAGAMTSRIANRMARVEKLSTSINPGKTSLLGVLARPFKPVGYWAAEAGLAESTYQIIKGVATESSGKDFDYMGALMDISIVTLTGGALGTFPMAKNFRKNLSTEELFDAMGNAVNGLRTRGFVGEGGSKTKPTKTKEQVEAEYDQTMADREQGLETHPDLKSPVYKYAQELGQDAVKFVDDMIDSFKRCIS